MAALKFIGFLIAAGLITAGQAYARTSLTALPQRDTVTVNMTNPDATLVEESRTLTLQKGLNRIDFSWQGVRIDPDSIQLKFPDHSGSVTILSVSFPPGGTGLTWEVACPEAREIQARIIYLLAGIDRLVTYEAVTGKEEKSMDLAAFLVLRNFSGEDYDRAGFILDTGGPVRCRSRHEETRRIHLSEYKDIPIQKTLTWDAAVMPHEPDKLDYTVGIPVSYTFLNSSASGLGSHALSPGKVRMQQDDGSGTTLFLGEDRLALTPVGKEAGLSISEGRDVSVTRHRMETKRINIRKDNSGRPQIYDEQIRDRLKIRNFKDQPVILRIIEHIQGEWEPVDFTAEYNRETASRLIFTVELAPDESREIFMHYTVKNIFAQRFAEFNRPDL